MATQTISAVMPGVQIDFLPDGAPTVSSKEVALHFQKKHKDVLRDIERIRSVTPKDFYQRNFAPIEIDVLLPHSGGIRKDPAYRLTRDGFSLLAMGFTGKAAVMWKLKYIEAFNALERAALDHAREAARLEGGQAALALAAKAYDRITPERMEKVRKAVCYKGKDLSEREIAKLLDCSRRSVTNYLQDAKTLGMGV